MLGGHQGQGVKGSRSLIVLKCLWKGVGLLRGEVQGYMVRGERVGRFSKDLKFQRKYISIQL